MRIETALNHQKRAIMQTRDLYSSAESFGLSSAQINERFNVILGSIAHCSGSIREYVRGYRQCLSDQLYRTALVHGGFVDGRFYSTHSNRPDYYERNGIKAVDYADDGRVTARGHYWIKHVDAGKPKVFFS